MPCQAHAFGLSDAVQSAIRNNPEVLVKLHEFRGADEDIGVGRADFLPTVDVSYEANRQKFNYPNSPGSPTSQNYTTRGWTLNVTQNLFQGLQSYNQVKELGYTKEASYFDFLDTSESIALQTVQAYEDVLRYKQLVEAAKDNYAVHEAIFNQLAQKVQAGVGRRVDLEQAAGRLALAQTNLLTDNANLQDVSARFERLTGSQPPLQMAEIQSFDNVMPKDSDVIKNAILHSPAYMSALASVRSAKSEVSVRRGAFSPTVNLQYSNAPTDNYDGYVGRTNQSSAAVIFSMNLFRGGADRARLGSAAEKLNASQDQRDKICRDMRQTLILAEDNMVKLKNQMQALLQHQLSTEKARDAYRKQFDIGQRTLLDVLDSENELFTAQRDYINAKSDFIEAQATILGNSGSLLTTLNLKPVDETLSDNDFSEEEKTSCSASYNVPTPIDVAKIPAHSFNTPESDSTPPASDTQSLTPPPLP
jgi:adhesin transport system outer membrane protein